MRKDGRGVCDRCSQAFDYHLIHNGFNESCYAYCGACGMTALVDTLYEDRAAEGLPRHRQITRGGEELLASCSCGGAFRAGAGPRCPHCHQELSAPAATEWIESNSPGAVQGWKWQRNWDGLYAIVIEGRVYRNPLREGPDRRTTRSSRSSAPGRLE